MPPLPIAPPNGTGTATLSGTITAPAGTLNGGTRMRISMKRGDVAPEPCEILPFGEVEDYRVNISGSNSGNLMGQDIKPNANINLSNMRNTNIPENKIHSYTSVKSALNFKIYPNPSTSNDFLFVETDLKEAFQIRIYNLLNQELASSIFQI